MERSFTNLHVFHLSKHPLPFLEDSLLLPPILIHPYHTYEALNLRLCPYTRIPDAANLQLCEDFVAPEDVLEAVDSGFLDHIPRGVCPVRILQLLAAVVFSGTIHLLALRIQLWSRLDFVQASMMHYVLCCTLYFQRRILSSLNFKIGFGKLGIRVINA